MNFGIEDETLEFKKSTGELNEAMNSICAMLNKHSRGTIYFGIMPNGVVCGQTVNESTLRDVSRKIYESIVPQIVPIIEKKVVDEKELIEVSFRGNDQPYSSKGVYYIRTADEDRVLPPNELRQLFEYNKSSWDAELTNYSIDSIKKDSLENFYKKTIACGRLKDFQFEPDRLLNKLGLMKNGKLTNAGYYLFSNDNPVVLKMAVFATDEKLTFLDINRVTGNIFDLIGEANSYIKKNMLWRADIVGLSRVETPEIPLKALREIICNSFAHARYNSNTEHEIDIHPSFIKIYNPGEFPIGYKPEDFIQDNIPSMIRNPLILKTLFLSDDVESYSSGFRRVYDECNKNAVETDYIISREAFSFIFKRNVVNPVVNSVVNSGLTETEILLIKLIADDPYISAAKLATRINMSVRSIQRILSGLKDKQVIERVGGTRGYWKVSN